MKNPPGLLAPFPYFGGKRIVTKDVWKRLGEPRQYIEPFCGSAAMLLAKPTPASLEVICDGSGFIANFWRAVKHQPAEVARYADYPVSHVDLGARHVWIMDNCGHLGDSMQDPDWIGDAKIAGWWLWGQCCWIARGWCDWSKAGKPRKISHLAYAGRGVQALGQIPHISNAGLGVQALGSISHISNAGLGVQAPGQISHVNDIDDDGPETLTSGGFTAHRWLHVLSKRLERVRIIHGDWSRCLNHNYGKDNTAVFLDPPYRSYEKLYGDVVAVADAVAEWAREHANLRVALCGHTGDYDLPGWDAVPWSRSKFTYGGDKTTSMECIWYSPACLPADTAADTSPPEHLP